jgi:hypothetical protein
MYSSYTQCLNEFRVLQMCTTTSERSRCGKHEEAFSDVSGAGHVLGRGGCKDARRHREHRPRQGACRHSTASFSLLACRLDTLPTAPSWVCALSRANKNSHSAHLCTFSGAYGANPLPGVVDPVMDPVMAGEPDLKYSAVNSLSLSLSLSTICDL